MIFFAIVPGFLIQKIFRIERNTVVHTVFFSIGLSVAFLLIVGAFINALGSLNLLLNPLSTVPSAVIVNVIVLLMVVISYFKGKGSKPLDLRGLKFWPLLTLFVLPVLSLIGVLLVRYYNNNILLISIIIAIAVFLLSSVVSSKASSKMSLYYPLIIVSIALSLLLSQSLMSNYMYGDDIQSEFNTFMATKNISYWNFQYSSYYQQSSDNSMMGITIFPTLLSNLLNIDPSWVFKLVFPVLFSLVPLGLYLLYRKYWTERISFISTIFFIANFVFFMVILTNAKQMIGELFYITLFLILFSETMVSNRNTWIVFMFAFVGLLVSHYSMTYVFLFCISFIWLGTKLFWKSAKTRISSFFIAFPFCLTFLWYAYVVWPSYGSGNPFGKLVGVFETTISRFAEELFSPVSRGGDVQAAIGLISRPSLLHYVGTILYDVTILLIFIGFIALIVKWKKGKFDSALLSIVSLNVFLLIAAVAIPRFAGFLELGRLYHILLIFLSPLFVIGSKAIVNILHIKHRKGSIDTNRQKKIGGGLLLASLVLVAFFIFQTGLVYEIAKDPVPSSFALSKQAMEKYDFGLIHESDVFSALWLTQYGQIENMFTFTDTVSLQHVLTSYSTIDRSMMLLLWNSTEMRIYDGTYIRHHNTFAAESNTTYIYLSQFSVAEERIPWYVQKNIYWNYSEIPILNASQAFVNRIYSNGASEIFYRVPLSDNVLG